MDIPKPAHNALALSESLAAHLDAVGEALLRLGADRGCAEKRAALRDAEQAFFLHFTAGRGRELLQAVQSLVRTACQLPPWVTPTAE